jgi:hypothetical protein
MLTREDAAMLRETAKRLRAGAAKLTETKLANDMIDDAILLEQEADRIEASLPNFGH